MTLRTFNIELRVDFDGEEKTEVMKTAAKMAAKHLYTTALLIADRRKPQIALHGSDFFAGSEEINLADDIPDVEGIDLASEEQAASPDNQETTT